MKRQINKKVLAQGIDRASESWDYAHDDQWQLYWQDMNNLPRAVYRIWVTDPKWLQHLSNGMAFASTAYSEKGPWVNECRSISV